VEAGLDLDRADPTDRHQRHHVRYGSDLFRPRPHAIGVATYDDQKKKIAPPAALPPDQLTAVINAGQPWMLAVIGLGGLAVITWLMMFKPF
jgi:hypothetical protein